MASSTLPHFPFTPGQRVWYVCIGDDPTYAQVQRPQFLVVEDTIKSVARSGKTFKLQGSRGLCEVSHFASRTFVQGDANGVQACVKIMAGREAAKHLHQSDPGVWIAGQRSPAALEKSAAVAEQLEAGDYDIVMPK